MGRRRPVGHMGGRTGARRLVAVGLEVGPPETDVPRRKRRPLRPVQVRRLRPSGGVFY